MQQATDNNNGKSFLSRKFLLGTSLGGALVFMAAGVIFWGGFNWAMEATNTMEFCTTCHEMEDNVYQEYKQTIHFNNRSGVQATCSDCHVPRPWIHKVVRKIQASNELFHAAMGTIDTPEKFDAQRLTMAKRVWTAMKETDSRECRNCHSFNNMSGADQKGRARKQHQNAVAQGNTCIDCHKGIAHKAVHTQLSDEELEAIEAPNPDYIRPTSAALAKEPKKTEAPAAAAALAPMAAAPAASSDGFDWSAVPNRQVTLFYPGQASIEWILNGKTHGGSRPFKAGDRCVDCHEEEIVDVGQKMVTGEKEGAEPTPIPGKRGSVPVAVKASYDDEYLYMQFSWADAEHAPVPFADGGKMDPENPVKLALMLATDEVEYADRAGCWGTCHADLRKMPFDPEQAALDAAGLPIDTSAGVTKYITESRTKLEIKGRRGKAQGGWDKLKDGAEIDAEMAAGHSMDILRYLGGSGESRDGHILAERTDISGQGVEFEGQLNGGVWSVEMKRKLTSDQPGDVSLEAGQLYNIGIALHDDYSNGRFHHVSFGYKFGLDNPDAEINATKR